MLQVERLRHHPSILVWAGNNENELGVRQWFFTKNYSLADSVLHNFMIFIDSTNHNFHSHSFIIFLQ